MNYLNSLRNTVLKFESPTEPVVVSDWAVLELEPVNESESPVDHPKPDDQAD